LKYRVSCRIACDMLSSQAAPMARPPGFSASAPSECRCVRKPGTSSTSKKQPARTPLYLMPLFLEPQVEIVRRQRRAPSRAACACRVLGMVHWHVPTAGQQTCRTQPDDPYISASQLDAQKTVCNVALLSRLSLHALPRLSVVGVYTLLLNKFNARGR
jgi:hypothetical protein